MSWLLAEHEGQGLRLGAEDRRPYHRTEGWVSDKSNNLVFFSFSTVPLYIYLENLENRLNTMRFALCLAMGSDRIIAKQGSILLGLSLNWYLMTQIVYFTIFTRAIYFETFLVRKLVDLKKHRYFLHSGI